MRTIERSSAFKRDYKRVKATPRHIKPDLLLIYRTSGADILRLARLGSHSELFS